MFLIFVQYTGFWFHKLHKMEGCFIGVNLQGDMILERLYSTEQKRKLKRNILRLIEQQNRYAVVCLSAAQDLHKLIVVMKQKCYEDLYQKKHTKHS